MYINPSYSSQQPKRLLRWFWITLSIIAGVLLVSCVGYIILIALGHNILAPTMNASATANSYYQAIENKDYTKAYSYLSPTFPVGGHEALSQAEFIYSAQAKDTATGPVAGFSQVGSSTNDGIVTVTMSITRGGRSYSVNLQLQENNGTWQIINADGI